METSDFESVEQPVSPDLLAPYRAEGDEGMLVVVKSPVDGKSELISHVNPFEKVRLFKISDLGCS